MDKDIPYFAINVPNDHCQDCGYTDEIGEECPVCGGKNIRRLRRVTGYSRFAPMRFERQPNKKEQIVDEYRAAEMLRKIHDSICWETLRALSTNSKNLKDWAISRQGEIQPQRSASRKEE